MVEEYEQTTGSWSLYQKVEMCTEVDPFNIGTSFCPKLKRLRPYVAFSYLNILLLHFRLCSSEVDHFITITDFINAKAFLDLTEQGLQESYLHYNEQVKESIPDLVTLDPAEGWTKLCEMLNVPEPSVPYPSLNKKGSVLVRYVVKRVVIAVAWYGGALLFIIVAFFLIS